MFSTAPAAPKRWPIIDLVLLTATLRAASPSPTFVAAVSAGAGRVPPGGAETRRAWALAAPAVLRETTGPGAWRAGLSASASAGGVTGAGGEGSGDSPPRRSANHLAAVISPALQVPTTRP